jgi:hypothetical protein
MEAVVDRLRGQAVEEGDERGFVVGPDGANCHVLAIG